jgi:glycosyltransferase involved in cell wall biosynthesis
VDDHSSDHSLDICKQLMLECPFEISMICNPVNKGVSYSRNVAIESAKGDYIAFVDSDDYIEPEYIEELLKNSIDHPNYLSMCKFKSIAHLKNENKTAILVETPVYLMNQYCFHPQSCGCLFSASIVKKQKIEFCEEAKFAEDAYFVAKYVLFTKGVSILGECLYIYDIREGTGSAQRKDKHFLISDVLQRRTSVNAFNDATQFAKKQSNSQYKNVDAGYCFLAADIMLMNERCEEKSNEIKKEMRSYLCWNRIRRYICYCKDKKHGLLVLAMKISPYIGAKMIEKLQHR